MHRHARILVVAVIVVTAALSATIGAFYQVMNPDGIAYLDIADAYARGDFAAAINPVWSPLYSWALVPLAILHPGPHWEFPFVHFTNFGIFLLASGAFAFFWAELTRYVQSGAAESRRLSSSEHFAWHLVGWSLFAWCSLTVISVIRVTP
ncbi:MAG TPA: hypothetical protein VMZ90_06155, partial [Vicinamibacterales bacterium]|nr:hypothetical protein [Vicinamibacterales bacterium]